MDTPIIDEQTQKELNIPLKDTEGNAQKDQPFLEMIMKLVNEGKIDLFKPGSLINQNLYDALPDEKKAQTDLEAANLLATIRDIKGLYEAGYRDTFQIHNLVLKLKDTKERLEEAGGDLFII